MLSYRSLRTHRLRCVACVTLHTNRVSLMHSVVCIVYVERYVQTIHIPVDTPASEVFSRPSTQIAHSQKKNFFFFLVKNFVMSKKKIFFWEAGRPGRPGLPAGRPGPHQSLAFIETRSCVKNGPLLSKRDLA